MDAQFGVELVKSLRPYGFLSCSKRRTPKTSLENLIHIFSWHLWTLLISTSILLGVFLLSTSKSKISKLEILSIGYNIFLEQGSSIARNAKGETHIYFACGPFLLTSLITSTIFRSDNVDKTIAPIRVLPYEKFDQLVENGFPFVDELVNYEAWEMLVPGWWAANSLALATIDTSFSRLSSKAFHHFLMGNVHVNHTRIRPETNIWWNYPHQILSNSSGFSCGSEKMAYLGWLEKLEEAKAYLENFQPGPEYSIGKEYVGVVPTGWVFENIVDPRILVRMSTLHHSGIAKKTMRYQEMAGKLRNRIPSKDFESKALTLDGNIAQIFKIVAQILFGTACIFLIEEIYWKLWHVNIKQFCILCIIMIKKGLSRIVACGAGALEVLSLIIRKKRK
ncbi:hypothetical protein Fcan01_11569 [Folsomia candida]|uniref:Uncharacterized protein n=1 Tax=Folsomia candida TaxID=158441 RepID=A0A226EAF3_FOLCA|nr:hypothetical protein Fcan01_11569 [Folsomia candida]